MTTVAIDFGTSNTIVSIIEADTQQPKILRFSHISRFLKFHHPEQQNLEISSIPTLVFIQETNQLIIGEQVRSQGLIFAQTQRLFKSFKRDLTANFQTLPRQIDGQDYSSDRIANLFIQEIWQQIKAQQIEPSQLIFTVPIGAFEYYLNWCKDLSKTLGIVQLKLIDESTAAALGYAIECPGSLVLVIDFGGGTLDLSLVRTIKAKKADSSPIRGEILAKSDAFIGGEDIDIGIVENYLNQIGSSKEIIGEVNWQNLLEIAERLKIALSSQEVAQESWLNKQDLRTYEFVLNREQLQTILEAKKIIEILKNRLDEILAISLNIGINKHDIEKILLVGGTCLIPAIQQLIISYFGKQKVELDKPFEAVAYGALAVDRIVEIEDYLHHSYAIRFWEKSARNYAYFTIFERGIKYPCRQKEPVTLQVATEGQTEIHLDIREVVSVSQAEVNFDRWGRMTSSQVYQPLSYHSLESDRQAVCIAHLDPPGEIGIDRISVQFEVDEHRILLATVQDLLTGKLLAERQAIAKLK